MSSYIVGCKSCLLERMSRCFGVGVMFLASVTLGAPSKPEKPLPPRHVLTLPPLATFDEPVKKQMNADEPLGPPGGHAQPTNELFGAIRVLKALPLSTEEIARIPRFFYWPEREVICSINERTVAASVKELDEAQPIAKWLKKILALEHDQAKTMKFYQRAEAVYCLWNSGTTMVRAVRNPLDITRKLPAEVQILTESAQSDDAIRGVVKLLSVCNTNTPLSETNLPLVSQTLATSPLSEKYRTATWFLVDFQFQSAWETVIVKFVSEVEQRPFSLWVIVGPSGKLLVLSGLGLEGLLEAENTLNRGNTPPRMRSFPQAGRTRGIGGIGVNPENNK